MERAFEHDGEACRIEARLEDDVWHVRAMRGDKVVCTAGRVPGAYRRDAESLGGADPLTAMLDAYERRIRAGEL
ncbi:hypothetical protein [Limimaricola cinnabarinus]|uniref:Uncharacterized protein n=1 Tax=Limimaricola cinnabarinus TaxID=1125964 RepID=A0A2G1MG71_9RHOB|nr:hypothetical protein [Limimaricola cinnabarinus]PHP27672.1 hypothetical protein CJ301_09745 [Limimaricola cinnabarinus]